MERYSNNQTNNNNNTLGNSLLLLIIITGLAGAIYTFMGNNSDSNTYEGTVLPTRINQKPGNNEEEAEKSLAKSIVYKTTAYLHLEGIREVGMPMSFQINRYNANGNYFLDLGNGEILHCRNASITYTYSKAGRYEIKLKVKYNGVTQTLHTETLYIEDVIELAGN